MATVSQQELHDDLDGVLRRAEAGEDLTVTVAGRPIARLGPVRPRQWVGGADLQQIWKMPAPESLADDLRGFPGHVVGVRDPPLRDA